jgi:hypothetical protein
MRRLAPEICRLLFKEPISESGLNVWPRELNVFISLRADRLEHACSN